MSLQDVFKAENLGRKAEDPAALAGKDLAEIRSEAGCNMLLVYLCNRRGRFFEAGQPKLIAGSEEFHGQVVDACLRAGCDADEEVATNKLIQHLPPSFRYQVKLRGKLSARTFLALLLRELHPEMYPEPYAQLERLAARLAAGGAAAVALPAPALEESLALLVWGVHWTGRVDPADEAAAQALGLELVVAESEVSPRGTSVVASDARNLCMDASLKLDRLQGWSRHAGSCRRPRPSTAAAAAAARCRVQGRLGAPRPQLLCPFARIPR